MYQRLIPSILIRQGRLVKGRQYGAYRDAGGPGTTARAHNAQGADELVVCDIDASKTGADPDYETLRKIADECFMPLTIFGGVNSLDRAARCIDVGADKMGLTAGAYDNPDLVTELAHRYGAQAVVLGLDIADDGNGSYALFDHRTGAILDGRDPFLWAAQMVDRGCGEIRLMSVSREGGLGGFDFALYDRLRACVNVPIVLEGGCGSLDHVEKAYAAGVDGVAIGSMLVFSDANLVKIKQHMRSRSLNIRP